MNRKAFLKLAMALFAPVAFCGQLFLKPRKQYLDSCRWDELIGVRMEWPCRSQSNPCPGKDWKIVERAENPFEYEGTVYENPRLNKFWIEPIGGRKMRKLIHLWSAPVKSEDGHLEWEYSRAYLPHKHFYRYA